MKTLKVLVLVGSWRTPATPQSFSARMPAPPGNVVADSIQALGYGPTSTEYWYDLISGAPYWPWNCREFWKRSTFGLRDLRVAVVDVGTVAIDQMDVWWSSRKTERAEIISAFRDHVDDNVDSIDLDDWDQIIAAPHPGPTNMGASGQDLVLTVGTQLFLLQHEVGHLLGLQHPFGFDDDLMTVEYADPYCVMGSSGVNVRSVWPVGGQAQPPSLPGNFWSSERRASVASVYRWIPELAATPHVRRVGTGELHPIAAAGLHRPPGAEAAVPHLLVLPVGRGELLLEHRINALPASDGFAIDDHDDQGLPGSNVVVHSTRLRSTSPKLDGDIDLIDRRVVYEGAMPAVPGVRMRLHGHDLKVRSASGGQVEVVCDATAPSLAHGSVRFDANGSRMDLMGRDGVELAIRSWTAWEGWTQTWSYPVRAHADMALTTSFPLPSLAVAISRQGRPVVARLGQAAGGGWVLLGARDEKGVAAPERSPKFSPLAPVAAAQDASAHLTVTIDANGTLMACAIDPFLGPKRESRWIAVPGQTLDPMVRPVITKVGPYFHVIARDGAGACWHTAVTTNIYDWTVPATEVTIGSAGWTQIGGAFPPAIPMRIGDDAGKVWVSLIDGLGHVRVAELGGNGWSVFADLGGEFTPGGTLGCVSRRSGVLELFGVSAGGQVLTAVGSASAGFGPWAPIPGLALPALAPVHVHAASGASDHVEVVIDPPSGPAWQTWWSPVAGWGAWFVL